MASMASIENLVIKVTRLPVLTLKLLAFEISTTAPKKILTGEAN